MNFWCVCLKLIIQAFIILFPLLGLSVDLKYKFNSQDDWKEIKTFIPGQLDDYVWSKNQNVKLLVGLKDEKRFFVEANRYSDEDIQKQFLAEALKFDFLNKWVGRKVESTLVQRSGDEIKIQTRYSMKKDGQTWYESNKYIFKQEGAIFFTLQYPSTVGNANSAVLEELVGSFDFSTNKSSVEFNYKSNRFFNSIAWTLLQRLRIFDEASAEDCSAELKRYPPSGDWSGQDGSANSNYEQLITEITWKSKVENPDQRELGCLAKIAHDEQSYAADYWSKRGYSEGCLTQENSNPNMRPPQCSEQSWNAFNKATEQINLANEKLEKALNPKTQYAKSKCTSTDEARGKISDLQSAGSNMQEKFCCEGVGNKKLDPKARGPLAQILYKDVESDFVNFPPEKQERACLDKVQPTTKRADFTGCAKSVLDGLVQVAKSTFNAIKSIFTWEAEKALWNFITGLPHSAVDVMKKVGEYLAQEAYVFNNCMNTYSREMYMCKMSGEILTMLLGPKMIVKFLGAISKGAKASGLTALVSEALKDSPKLQKALSAAKSGEKPSSAKTPAPADVVDANASAVSQYARKVIQIAKLDVTAPIKDAISKRVKAFSSSGAKPFTPWADVKIVKPNPNAEKPSLDFTELDFTGHEAKAAAAAAGSTTGKVPVVAPVPQSVASASGEVGNSTGHHQSHQEVKASSARAAALAWRDSNEGKNEYVHPAAEYVEPPAIWKIESAAKKVKDAGYDIARGTQAKKEFYQMAHGLDSAAIESNMSEFRQISGGLTNAERVDAASRLVGRELNKDEKIAILHSELIGKSAGRGYDTYTDLDKTTKRKILEEANFTQEEVNKIEFSGLNGSPPPTAE